MLPALLASAPDLDPVAALPAARALRDAAKAHDWSTVDTGFGRLVEPAAQVIALSAIGRVTKRAFIEEVFAGDPTSPLAGTLLAWRLVEDGWKIRTGGWARNVSPEQWQEFHDYLRRAEQILIEVTARHPGFPCAWYERQLTARGLELGQSEARRRYQSATRAASHFYPAQWNMIQQLCPKWGGSYEAMHAFAVQCTKESPPGSVNGAVVAEAHIEHWLLLKRDQSAREAVAYLKLPGVQEELLWAAGHSVLNPQFRPAAGWVRAHSAFAMAFSLAENYPAAAPHFDALLHGGNLADKQPWSYLGNDSTMFVAYRTHALKKKFRQ